MSSRARSTQDAPAADGAALRPADLSPSAAPIVKASLRLFREVGFHGTAVRDIAREADMNVAAMYHYFRSKQDLLFYIMWKAMRENLSLVQRGAESSTDPTAQISAMIAGIIEYHTGHPAEAFVGNSELRSLEGEALAAVIAMRDQEEAIFTEVIARGVAAGEFLSDEPKQSARAIIAMCSAVATWYRPGGRWTTDTIVAQYVAMGLQLLGRS